MSIAASVVVNPSKLLRLLQAATGLAIVGVAIRLAFFELSELSPALGFGVSLLVALPGVVLIYSALDARKSFQLDISGLGEIRLREHYAGAVADRAKSSPDFEIGSEQVRLRHDSTILPRLLVLRFVHADGASSSLVVLPDMVEPEAFRALAVAVQWIAAREKE